MMRTLLLLLGVSLGLAAGRASAQPTIDGSLDSLYGAALSTQDTQTNFGDSQLGDFAFATGSEFNAAHAYVTDEPGIGRVLYLFVTGNLESNFNKAEFFFDTKAGGQNRLRGDNPDVDFDGLNRMGDDGSGNGLTFDTGFEPDYWISITGGGEFLVQYDLYANYAELLTEGGGQGYYLGHGGALTDGTLIEGANNPHDIRATIDNSNFLGVTGGTGLDNGAGVTTGIELRIPFAALGNPVSDLRVSTFVNGQGHDFVSNQVLGPIGGGDNLGEVRNVNFNNVLGDQFFTIDNPFAMLPGDGNGDNVVDGADFTIWADGFGLFNGDAQVSDGDYNFDGFVNGADFTTWADHFGEMLGSPVPEPASVVLVLAAAAAGVVCWRRRA